MEKLKTRGLHKICLLYLCYSSRPAKIIQSNLLLNLAKIRVRVLTKSFQLIQNMISGREWDLNMNEIIHSFSMQQLNLLDLQKYSSNQLSSVFFTPLHWKKLRQKLSFLFSNTKYFFPTSCCRKQSVPHFLTICT